MFELTRRNNNHMNGYNPFRDTDEFERNFFGNPFDNFFGFQDLAEFKTDLTDEGDSYLLEADLPGFEKKDIDINIKGDVMTVRAERHSKIEEKDDKNKIIHMERSYGSYSRDFDVSGVDVKNIRAKYENGVLKLNLPKKAEEIPESTRLEIE